ncbi:MAG: HYR domain-containing protein [Bacteroidetes bacterium]|nr:HYR domain-containing protein [Bacteroidota bacterium]
MIASGTGPFDIVVNGVTYNNVPSGSVFATLTEGVDFTGATNFNLTQITDANNCVISGLAQTTAVSVNTVNAGSIGGTQTVCPGGDPQAFSSVTAGTGTGTITYRWEQSTSNCNGAFTPIPSSNSTTYNPPANPTQTTYYRRITISTLNGVTCEAISNCVIVTLENDLTPPVITCPAAQMVTLGANCSATLPNYTSLAIVSDNCGIKSVTQSPAPGTFVSGLGNTTVTITATDNNNNTAACSFVVTGVDNTLPSITCPATQTLSLGANCSALLPDYTSLAVRSDNCGIKSVTQFPTAGTSVSGIGSLTITITATDNNDNVKTCTFIVNKLDTSPPSITCPATQTLALGANCSAILPNYTSLAVALDNCGIKSVTQSPVAGTTVSGLGNITVTITATDDSGNSSSCAFTVTRVDNTPPSITCPANITVNNITGQCGAVVTYTAPVGTDNCSGVTTTQIEGLTSGSTFPVGVTTNRFRVTDGSNLTAECSFTVTVVDVEPPKIVCPANITVNNTTGECGAVVTYTAPVGVDNCTGATTTQIAGLSSGSTFPVGMTTNTFRVTDANNQTAECSFTVTVVDVELPKIVCPANITVNNTTGQCGAVVTYTAPVGTDNCSGATTTQIAGLASGSVFPVGVTTNTFRVTDGVNLTAECSFTVTVVDAEPPKIVCPANITVNNTPGQCGAVVTYTAPVGTDNCTGATTTQIAGLASGATFPVGVTTNRFRVTDGVNLTAECSFTVTVVDVEAPKITCPANITVNNTSGQCGAVVTYTAPVGTDNCTGVTTTQIAGLASGETFPVGVTTNTFRVTDGANLTAECSFTVTVVDVEPPKITCPANITVNNTPGQCGAVVTYNAPVGTDNCSGVTTTQIAGLASGATFPVGVTTNTFRVTDGANLTAECSFTVTVVDAEPPKITCPANITVNNTPGQCGAVVTYNAPVGTDNCSGVTTTQIAGLASGSVFPVGVTTNRFRVTDGVNLTAECSFTVTVVDVEPPTIVCPANIVVFEGTRVTYVAPVGTDNCSGAVTSQTSGLGTGVVYPVGVTTNTFKVTASNGQTAECSFTVTVISKPTITLSTLQQTLTEGTSQEVCDTDANPANSLQFTVTTGCVINDPVWRVQVGSGAWSEWLSSPPATQVSNNQLHRYQAACSASNPVTYTSPITVQINYRASTPQQVSLVADGVTVKEGESKEVCNTEGNALIFNATCAAGEVLLYSVDGGDYSSVVPTQLVDGQFHNYRVRCRKSDGTASCIESESGVMRLKITNGLGQVPVASLNVTSGCGTPVSFSGTASCGNSTTVWYNASTNVALATLPSQTPIETTSYYARCQAGGGCLSEKSNVVTYTVIPVSVAPVVTASQEIVCTGTSVTVSANCPAGSQTFWNTGVMTPSFEISFSNVTKQTYWAKCVFGGGCQSSESVKKEVYWNAFVVTLINVGQTKSAVKSANDKALWNSQFIVKDGGPELAQSTQSNPTLYYAGNVNKVAPRYWTINVDACGLGTEGSLTFDLLATPETGVPQSFNTHENNAPYFMYANRDGWTELYAQNHPAYGFYQDNGAGANVYDLGLPKGLYKLGIRYWDMKGWGSIYPSTRKPQGNVLAYQEYWFRIQSKDGVGVGAARTGDSGLQEATDLSSQRFTDARDLSPNVFAQVMPNPVSTVLRLQVQGSKEQKVQTTLMDASGRSVLRRDFVPETNTHQEEFGVSELPTGMYFLQVTSLTQHAILKVLKVK